MVAWFRFLQAVSAVRFSRARGISLFNKVVLIATAAALISIALFA